MVVRHEAPRKHLPLEPRSDPVELVDERVAVGVVEDDRVSPRAAAGHVIGVLRIDRTCLPSHVRHRRGRRVTRLCSLINGV